MIEINRTKTSERKIFLNFLQKIQPHLTSNDLFVQKFVLYALQEYPEVPAEWTTQLINEAIHHKEKELNVLIDIRNHPLNEEAAKLIIDGINKTDKVNTHLYLELIKQLPPEVVVKYQDELENILTKDTIEFYRLLANGSEEEVWEEYGAVLGQLNNEEWFNQQLYSKAKLLIKTLVQKGWIDEKEVDMVLHEELNNEWFSDNGILMVYAIGLLRLEKYIPVLASLLVRDEDILLEEVSDALTVFQSDDVVRAVAPYAMIQESEIFAISILGNTKTPLAVDVLRKVYWEQEDEETKALVIEALCHQLTDEAMPEIEDYIHHDYRSFLIEVEELLYGWFKVMDKHHPLMEHWKRLALENKLRFQKNQGDLLLNMPFRNTEKVGRNDPCPCGSGKKYKKCCLK
jgi:SEC-C motif